MSRGKELVKNTAIVAVGKASTKLVYFLLLPFYTAVLSTEDYGVVDLFNTYVALLLPIVAFQLEDALFRFMVDVRTSKEKQQKVVSTIFGFAFLQIVIFSTIIATVSIFVKILYLEYLWLNVIASILLGLLLQYSRGLGDNLGYAIGGFVTAFLNIMLNIIFILALDMRAEGMLVAAIVSNYIGVIYLFVRNKAWQCLKLRFLDKALLKEILAYALPLVPNYLCWWVVNASDKMIVNYFLDISSSGILAVSQKFSTAYSSFYSIFNLTWTESAAVHRMDKDSDEYYSFVIGRSFRLLASACMGIIALVAVVFPIMVNEKFASSYHQIPIYMIAAFLSSVIGIYSVVYIAHKKTAGIAKTSFVAAAVNLIVHIGLIRYIGLYASSLSTVIAYGVMFLIRYFDIKKYATVRMKRSVVASCLFMIAMTMIVYYVNILLFSIAWLCVVTGFALYINRAVLGGLKKILFKRGKNE